MKQTMNGGDNVHFWNKNVNEKSARTLDKQREADQRKSEKKPKKQRKRIIKSTTIQTMPYECFVSNHVMLLKSNVLLLSSRHGERLQSLVYSLLL